MNQINRIIQIVASLLWFGCLSGVAQARPRGNDILYDTRTQEPTLAEIAPLVDYYWQYYLLKAQKSVSNQQITEEQKRQIESLDKTTENIQWGKWEIPALLEVWQKAMQKPKNMEEKEIFYQIQYWIREDVTNIAYSEELQGATPKIPVDNHLLKSWRSWWVQNKHRPYKGIRSDQNILACLKDYFYAKDQNTRLAAAEDLDWLAQENLDKMIEYCRYLTHPIHNPDKRVARDIAKYISLCTKSKFKSKYDGKTTEDSESWSNWWNQNKGKLKWPSHAAHVKNGRKWSDPYDIPPLAPEPLKGKTPND